MSKGMYPCWSCGKHLKKGENFEINTDLCPRCVSERDTVLARLRENYLRRMAMEK